MTTRRPPQPRRAAAQSVRVRTALALRCEGLTFEQIGKRLGVTKQAAHGSVQRELRAVAADRKALAEHQVDFELAQIDSVIRGMSAAAAKGDARAGAVIIKAMERRAKLLGLDAPTKADVTSGGKAIQSISPDDPRWRELQAQHLGSVRQGVADEPARPNGDADPVAP